MELRYIIKFSLIILPAPPFFFFKNVAFQTIKISSLKPFVINENRICKFRKYEDLSLSLSQLIKVIYVKFNSQLIYSYLELCIYPMSCFEVAIFHVSIWILRRMLKPLMNCMYMLLTFGNRDFISTPYLIISKSHTGRWFAGCA